MPDKWREGHRYERNGQESKGAGRREGVQRRPSSDLEKWEEKVSGHVGQELEEEGDGEDVLEHDEKRGSRVCTLARGTVQLRLDDVDEKAEEDEQRHGALHRDAAVGAPEAEPQPLHHAGPRLRCLLSVSSSRSCRSDGGGGGGGGDILGGGDCLLHDQSVVCLPSKKLHPLVTQFFGIRSKIVGASAVVKLFSSILDFL